MENSEMNKLKRKSTEILKTPVKVPRFQVLERSILQGNQELLRYGMSVQNVIKKLKIDLCFVVNTNVLGD